MIFQSFLSPNCSEWTTFSYQMTSYQWHLDYTGFFRFFMVASINFSPWKDMWTHCGKCKLLCFWFRAYSNGGYRYQFCFRLFNNNIEKVVIKYIFKHINVYISAKSNKKPESIISINAIVFAASFSLVLILVATMSSKVTVTLANTGKLSGSM